MYLDTNYYRNTYPDLRRLDNQGLFRHWHNYGMTEKRYPNNFMKNLGFIILRHVAKKQHDQYWQECYKCIRKFYNNNIIIIDDNSNYEYISDIPLINTEIVQSEYVGRGELLPYLYYLKNNWFQTAFILHDSVFINKPLYFSSIDNFYNIWTFYNKIDRHLLHDDILKLVNHLNNANELLRLYNSNNWEGIFGCMTIINYSYLKKKDNRYSISNLIPHINNRHKRMCLERLLALLLFNNINHNTILGNIHKDKLSFRRNFNIYKSHKNNYSLIKIWTGR